MPISSRACPSIAPAVASLRPSRLATRTAGAPAESPGTVLEDAGAFVRDLPHARVLGEDTPTGIAGVGQKGYVGQFLCDLVAVVLGQGDAVQAVHLGDLAGNLRGQASVDEQDLGASRRPWPPTPGVRQPQPPPAR